MESYLEMKARHEKEMNEFPSGLHLVMHNLKK